MMKVRMISIYAGPNGSCQSGGTIVLDPEEANQLIEGGYAELVEEVVSDVEVAQEQSDENPDENPDENSDENSDENTEGK